MLLRQMHPYWNDPGQPIYSKPNGAWASKRTLLDGTLVAVKIQKHRDGEPSLVFYELQRIHAAPMISGQRSTRTLFACSAIDCAAAIAPL